MEKGFCQMTIEELNLNLLDIRGSDVQTLLEGLTIYPKTRRELDFCGRKVILAVIGESHFIFVPDEFFELLVCKILPPKYLKGLLFQDKKIGNDLDNCFCRYGAPGFIYYFKSRFIDYCQEQRFSSEGKLLYAIEEEFPFDWHGETIPCKTRLHLSQTNARTLCLQTRHDYPAPDGISVLTKSIWNFPRIRS